MKKLELAINTFILLIGRLSGRLVIFLLLPLYTKFLSTEQFGVADLYSTYVTLLIPVVSVELGKGLFRFLVDVRNNKDEQYVIFKSCFDVNNKYLFVFSVLYMIAFSIWKFDYAPILYSCVVTGIYKELIQQMIRGEGDNKKYALSSFVEGAFVACSNIVFIRFLHLKTDGILLSMIVGYIGCSFYLLLFSDIKKAFMVCAENVVKSELVRYSMPLVLNTVCWWLLNASDRVIISNFLGASSNGIYAVSCKFPTLIAGVVSVFVASWSESASLHAKDIDASQFFNDIFDASLRILVSICIAMIAFMPVIFPIFVKESFYEAYFYIPFAMFGVLLNSLANIFSGLFIALKKTKESANSSMLAAAVNLVIDVSLIRFIGLYSAYLSTAIASLILISTRQMMLNKYIRCGYNAKNFIFLLLAFSVSCLMYLANNSLCNILNMIFSIFFAVIVNRKLINDFFLLRTNRKLLKQTESEV